MILLALLALIAGLPSPAAAADVAGSVVRSKEWVVRRGAREEEEFKGDVRYKSADTQMSADWALYRRRAQDWKARGRVRLLKTTAKGDVVEARGETASYSQKTAEGTLDPAPGRLVEFSRLPAGAEGQEPDRGEGRRLTWTGQRAATLEGAVRAWGPRVEFWADRARYETDGAAKRLTLSGGRPVLVKLSGDTKTAVKADQIVGAEPPRRITATGKAVGWVVFPEGAAKETAR